MNKIESKMYLFCVKENKENSIFSHLTLASSVDDLIARFNADLDYLVNSSIDIEEDKAVLSKVLNYFENCEFYCLGSIDFVSGDLVPYLESHGFLKDLLNVFKEVE